MDWHIAWWSFTCLLAGIVLAAALFRTPDAAARLPRGPFFLVTGGLMLFLGLMGLPAALPRTFGALLGHSVWDHNWLLVRWIFPLRSTFQFAVLIALVWAVVNIVKRRSRKLNLIALAIAVVWVAVSIYISFASVTINV